MQKNPIIVALDVPSTEEALELAGRLAGFVGGLKVGSELFTRGGPEIVRRLRGLGHPVFLDLKFHDIPNTVAKAVASAVAMDVQMLTVHACGGSDMLRAAEEAAVKAAAEAGREAPLVLGVTVLTSMDDGDLSEVGVDRGVAEQVSHLARLASDSGLRGLVCSPREIEPLRQILPASIRLVTPGIRSAGAAAGDQKRTLTPREAIDAGANWLVIGRPIYQAGDPASAAQEILASLTSEA